MRGSRIVLGIEAALVAALLAAAGAVSGWTRDEAPLEPLREGPRRGLLVVHGEWIDGARHAAALGRSCPEGTLLDAEIAAVRRAAGAVGVSLEVVTADRFSPPQVEGVDVVVHHNGGWGSSVTPVEAEALLTAARARVPLMFVGDDAAVMLWSDPRLAALGGLESRPSNGRMPMRVQMGDRTATYAKEPDLVQLASGARPWMRSEDTVVAWSLGDRDAAVAVFDLGLRASDVCGLFRAEDEPYVADQFGRMLRSLVDAD